MRAEQKFLEGDTPSIDEEYVRNNQSIPQRLARVQHSIELSMKDDWTYEHAMTYHMISQCQGRSRARCAITTCYAASTYALCQVMHNQMEQQQKQYAEEVEEKAHEARVAAERQTSTRHMRFRLGMIAIKSHRCGWPA